MPPRATLTGVQVGLMVLQVTLSALTVLYLMTYVSASREVQAQQQCQIRVNSQTRDAIAARATAQNAFTEAELKFTIADRVWVAEQIRVIDASRNKSLSQADRDRLTDQWHASLVDKYKSADEKETALRVLNDARQDNPLDRTNC